MPYNEILMFFAFNSDKIKPTSQINVYVHLYNIMIKSRCTMIPPTVQNKKYMKTEFESFISRFVFSNQP